jgi:NADH:ubiquinone oxidoreductase subunit C
MNPVGINIIKKEAPDIDFMARRGSDIHFMYHKKSLKCLMYFEQANALKRDVDKLKIHHSIINKACQISKSKGINSFYVFYSLKREFYVRIKISDKQGEVSSVHKVSRRDGDVVNYIFLPQGDKEVIIRQFPKH